MTRYARAGKGTHQRVAKDATSWDELKPPSPERKRGSKSDTGTGPKKRNFVKERFSKNRASVNKSNSNGESNSFERRKGNYSESKMKDSKNPNVRGFGQSKSVKVFGQFWVPLDDAKRLKNLLGKLRAQGLPRKEILEALKNDRRKAEKSAKRQRDKTCFQCRQFGHILSDCPNLRKAAVIPGSGNDEDVGDLLLEMSSEQGLICFKCGSTEHTSRKCRRKGENFEFASCFICSGSGHIARQCPENKRGIYPSGGSCGECGSITHLKKDCPDLAGAEVDPSSVDDPDAVTLRLADPFSSTEYEPVFETEAKNEDEDEKNVEEEKPIFSGANNVPIGKKGAGPVKKQKKKGKRKNVMEEEEASFQFNFETMESPAVGVRKLFGGSDPKKRKVVKF